MKDFLFILLCIFSFNLYSQNEIVFKVAYQPEMVYKQSTESTSRSEMTYGGSEEFLKKLEDKGVKNPTINLGKTFVESINSTGKLSNEKFPLSMRFIGGEKAIIPDGTILYAKVKVGENPVFDSIYAPKMETKDKDILFETIKSSMSQLNFPEKNVKVGETFTQKIPLKIPIGKIVVNLISETTYKLIRIKDKKAFFDITQVYTLISDIENTKIKAFGNGTGEVIYDIENTFYLLYELDSALNMEVQIENTLINVLSQSNTKISSIISKK